MVGEGRFSSYTASSSTFGAGMFSVGQSDQAKAEYRWQRETKRCTRTQSSASQLLYLSRLAESSPLPRPMGSTHTLQITHTLHVDGMARVENGWQTSNGGAAQVHQDFTICTSGGHTRALKAQRRGRGRGVLGITQGSHLASSLSSAIASSASHMAFCGIASLIWGG